MASQFHGPFVRSPISHSVGKFKRRRGDGELLISWQNCIFPFCLHYVYIILFNLKISSNKYEYVRGFARVIERKYSYLYACFYLVL